jgi:hypothetical protein
MDMISIDEVVEQEDGSAILTITAKGEELEMLVAEGFLSVLRKAMEDVSGIVQD